MPGIVFHEVGMRDGLQMEREIVPTEQKIRWITSLLGSNVDIIQLGSFVHPKYVPQMADTDALFHYFSQPGKKPAHTVLSGLVLNEKGLERGLACGVDMFCMGVSASETHSKKNTNMSVDDALKRTLCMAAIAMQEGKAVQASVQSAFGCGYEGRVAPDKVLRIIEAYLKAGIKTVSLADTAGHADPQQVDMMFDALFDLDATIECACHFHNTYGMAIANCYSAWKRGVLIFEGSFGGLGGCPFTAIAGGNACSEDLVHMFQRMGRRKDIKLAPMINVAQQAAGRFKRELPGMLYRAGAIEDQALN